MLASLAWEDGNEAYPQRPRTHAPATASDGEAEADDDAAGGSGSGFGSGSGVSDSDSGGSGGGGGDDDGVWGREGGGGGVPLAGHLAALFGRWWFEDTQAHWGRWTNLFTPLQFTRNGASVFSDEDPKYNKTCVPLVHSNDWAEKNPCRCVGRCVCSDH